MSIDIISNQAQTTGLPIIKTIGVGGGGGNVVNRMIRDGIQDVSFVAANTDAVVIKSSLAHTTLLLGTKVSKGVGAGMNPEIGRMAAEEEQDRIREILEGTDMLFIAAGMGGGTGTGAAPIIAEIAKEMKILTVGVVTTPFVFEGKKRARLAEQGIEELRKHVDTLMIIPNNKLLEIVSPKTTMEEAFSLADDVLKQAISGITNLINLEGVINLDFADVKTVMTDKGRAFMGTGIASGENRGLKAAEEAIKSPLLSDKQISGATGVIINIVADPNFSLLDAQAAAELIETASDPDADVIFGFVQDNTKNDEVAITVIATGFQSLEEQSESTSQRDGMPLRIVDSMKNQSLPKDQTESISNYNNQESLEDIVELNQEYAEHNIENKLHIPDYLKGVNLKDDDYDTPTFARDLIKKIKKEMGK